MDSRVLTAHVVLRAARDLTKEKVEPSQVDEFLPDPEVSEAAVSTLNRLGFTIRRRGPFSITVVGEPAVFERVFHARLRKPGPENAAEAEWEAPLEIPADLKDLVKDVVFPHRVRPLGT